MHVISAPDVRNERLDTVRRATLQDIETLVELCREFHEFHVEGIPDRLQIPGSYDDEELRSKLTEIMKAEDSMMYVVEVDGQVVGFAEAYLKQDAENPYRLSYKYVHLQSIMVSKSCRRENIGMELLSAVEQWARKRAASEVRLDIWEFRDGPLGFYEKQGYRTLRRTMVRKL